jgi:hypothetical protein
MVWHRLGYVFLCVLVLGAVFRPVSVAFARDTEAKLLAKIEREKNPVKKAKLEIKLARLRLQKAQDAYAKGNPSEGLELLNAYMDNMGTSWQLLRDSGRQASRKPQGFKELEIALREDSRALEDLRQSLSYYDQRPVRDAIEEVLKMRSEVLHALFPGMIMKPKKGVKHFLSPAGNSGERR